MLLDLSDGEIGELLDAAAYKLMSGNIEAEDAIPLLLAINKLKNPVEQTLVAEGDWQPVSDGYKYADPIWHKHVMYRIDALGMPYIVCVDERSGGGIPVYLPLRLRLCEFLEQPKPVAATGGD